MSNVLIQLIDELNAGRLKLIDLTRPLGPKTPVIELPPMFASSPGFSMQTISRYDAKGPAWYWNTINVGEHTGTHFDAPVHWITGKDLSNNTCETIPARRFVGPACVIDVSREAAANPDFLLTRERILAWEAQYGRIPANSWVLVRTDWSKRADSKDFLNISKDGPHNPGFHRSASEFLAKERDVLGVGVEAVGTDAGQAGTFDLPFPSHSIMHGAGKFGLASLCNLDQLPPTGAIVIAAPLKIVDGSGSPLRVLAIAPA
ncbi:cyclase family protein [Candidatus Acetothermia bacterium]|nr:cyclase family protein [Candidatus Acetothermia bacterium]